MSEASGLSLRQRRLADAPAQIVLAVLPLVGKGQPPLDAVELSPVPDGGEGLLVRAGSPSAVLQIAVDAGEATEPVSVPLVVLQRLKRRHGDAVRLVADLLGDGLVIRSFGADATLGLNAAPAPSLPPWPEPGPDLPDADGELHLEPRLVSRVMEVAAKLGCGAVSWRPIADGSTFGGEVGLDGIGPNGERIHGWIRIARCAAPRTLAAATQE